MDSNERMWAEIPPTGRTAEEYFKDLQINAEYLKNKKVLDIGAGRNVFAKELKDQGIDLVSLDAFYALSPEQREEVFKELDTDDFAKVKADLNRITLEEKDSQLVAGRAESLPFQDETFDCVLAEFSLPNYADNPDQIRNFFVEVARVLLPNGEARIYPLFVRNKYELGAEGQKALEDSLEILRNQGLDVEVVGDKLLVISKPDKK